MVAGARARAQHVNTNFDNFRGHIIPINTDTATASHQTHDLGSADHQFRRIYLKEPPVIAGAGSAKFEVEAFTDATMPTDILDSESWLGRTSFPSGLESGITFQFVVPESYTPGNRISATLRGYCDTSPSQFAMEMGTALYRASATAMNLTAPSNAFTSTSSIQPTLSGVYFQDTSLRLTDASGVINGITLAAGDILSCYIKRKGAATGDTNTGYFHLTNLVVDLNN